MSALVIAGLSVALPPGADRAFALQDVSLTLNAGEILCVVGESGSGKSMTANAVMRLLPPGVAVTVGSIMLGGVDVLALDARAVRRVRGAKIAMIFQEPMTALNPLLRIGDQIGEMFRTHTELGRAEIARRVLGLLTEVGLPDPAASLRAYPHELSGGQRQRAMIAMALALEPDVLVADEPTTALDVTTQAQILALIRDLQRRRGMAVLFITHDFGVVADIADRIAVMQAGRVVEQGVAADVLSRPQHPYTRALIAAVPPLTRIAPVVASDAPPILVLDRVRMIYGKPGLFGRSRVTRAVDDVSLALPRGSVLGIVGGERVGQVDAGAVHRAVVAAAIRGDPAGWGGFAGVVTAGDAGGGGAGADGVPRPVRVAESAAPGGGVGGAGADAARGQPGGGDGSGAGIVRAGGVVGGFGGSVSA